MLPAVQRGILGGTFDPPHLAHLMAGEAAYRQLGLDVITLLPAGAPWQKADRQVSAPAHRWEMTRASVDGVEYFEADSREVDRDGWTFTADTLKSFDAAEELTLILGADAATRIPTWHRVDDVLKRARLAVIRRPGTSQETVESAVPASVTWLDTPEIGISGTMLRARVAAGLSIRFLVREPVWRYITEHRLYD